MGDLETTVVVVAMMTAIVLTTEADLMIATVAVTTIVTEVASSLFITNHILPIVCVGINYYISSAVRQHY